MANSGNDGDNTGMWIGLIAVVVIIGALFFINARSTSDNNYSTPTAATTSNNSGANPTTPATNNTGH